MKRRLRRTLLALESCDLVLWSKELDPEINSG